MGAVIDSAEVVVRWCSKTEQGMETSSRQPLPPLPSLHLAAPAMLSCFFRQLSTPTDDVLHLGDVNLEGSTIDDSLLRSGRGVTPASEQDRQELQCTRSVGGLLLVALRALLKVVHDIDAP